MPLAVGTRLGPYEVLDPLGFGGMGEVYRARDSRLDRIVAVKVIRASELPARDQVERFKREARAISQLSHPHICVLHDIGDAPAFDAPGATVTYLVMEYLEGETLSARLGRGALPLPATLLYAVQIADALDHAHRHAIVHRDLKPGNIIITKAGAKLLDFGLAKLRTEGASPVSALSTMSTPLTAAGTILGTLQYMAPEQLEGREADARSDVFAFGAIVHEMATGRKAFDANSQAAVIAAILERDPPSISSLKPLTPPKLDHIVSRCLTKDPDERWQSSRDLLLELKDVAADASPGAVSHRLSPVVKSRGRFGLALLGGAIAIVLGVEVGRTFMPSETLTTVRPARFVIATLSGVILPPPAVAIAPDGGRVVYAFSDKPNSPLYVRPVDQVDATAIPGTEGASMPFFSPDGAEVGFFAQGKLKTVQLGGNAPTTLCDAPEPRGGTWGPDGTIVFAATPFAGLSRIPSQGGNPEIVTTLDKTQNELSHRWPSFLPDGSGIIFTTWYADYRTARDDGAIALYSLTTGTHRVVLKGGTFPRVLMAGYLLFAHRHALLAVPFDLKRGAVSGRPITVENDIITVTGWGSAQFAVSHDGTLAYMRIVPEARRQLTWVDRTGREEPLPLQPHVFSRPRVSPDATRLLVVVRDADPAAVWVYDTTRRVFGPFASLKSDLRFSPTWSPSAVWSPDGRWIAYTTEESDAWTMWRKPTDGSAREESLFAHPVEFAPTSWSTNGFIALDERTFRTRIDVAVLPVNEARAMRPVVNSELVEQNARFSPDGRWLAYDSGFRTSDVYVRAFPGPGPTIQVSDAGGSTPVWAPNARELFYWTRAGIARVSVSVNDGLSTGPPQVIVPGTFAPEFDLSPDGRRFLLMKQLGEAPPLQLEIATGWLNHVQRLTSSAASR